MAKAFVDKDACVGCETCVGTCPLIRKTALSAAAVCQSAP